MSRREYLAQRWRSILGLSVAGGMLCWARFLDPSAAEWLSGMYSAYWGLCIVASLASLALALQETTVIWRRLRPRPRLSLSKGRPIRSTQQGA